MKTPDKKKRKKKKLKKETSVTGNVAGFALPLGIYDVRKDPNVVRRSKQKAAQNAVGRSKSEPRGWNYLENKDMTLKNILNEEDNFADEKILETAHNDLMNAEHELLKIKHRTKFNFVNIDLINQDLKHLQNVMARIR